MNAACRLGQVRIAGDATVVDVQLSDVLAAAVVAMVAAVVADGARDGCQTAVPVARWPGPARRLAWSLP